MIKRTLTILTAGTLLAAGSGTAVVAAEDVVVRVDASQMTVDPRVSGEAMTATLSCDDGTYVEREFESVSLVSLRLADEDGRPVTDGQCSYEVRVHPVVDHEALRAAQEDGDDERVEELSRSEQEDTVYVDGSFQILNGVVTSTDDSNDQ